MVSNKANNLNNKLIKLLHINFLVPLIVKLMRTTCRVPLQLLALRLSILYLRTCVGLGYGSSFTLKFNH